MFGLLGLIKGVAVVCSMAFALPVGGVYASADSPSKYLDRLTTVNTSVNREGGGVSSGLGDEPTVSRAVRTSHGVVLNTVVRNANRLEYVDDRVEPVHETVTRSAQGEWPAGGFNGESTITYDANGKGSFADGAPTNVITTKYNGFNEITKYAHTDNVDDTGEQFGGYNGHDSDFWGYTDSKVVSIPGAKSLTVTITYQTEPNDWVCLYPGGNEEKPAGNADCSEGTVDYSGRLGEYTMTTQSFTVDGDSVTFWFKSDGYPNSYYGYYAVVSGLTGSKDTVTGSYQEPVSIDPDYDFTGWNTKANGSGKDIGKGEVSSPSSLTVYAQWKSNWNKWGTIGWKITDDGVLRIRPWEGNTGTTGSATAYYDAPWYNQASNIKKVESTGTIVLNANSSGLFNGCSSLTDLTALKDWNASNVTNMSRLFEGCSNLTNLTALKDWKSSKVTDMDRMFYDCSSLTDLTALASWSVSKVTDMSYMFYGCSKLTDLTGLKDWNAPNVTNMRSMFDGCSSLTKLTGLAGWSWNVSKVTNMLRMFAGCSKLTDLTALKDWNVSSVTNMSNMFDGCSSLTSLTGLANWTVSKVTNMSNMFDGCSSLTDLTALASWSVSNVTDMSSMFDGCSSLTALTGLSGWNVSNVTNMSYMFSSCSSLTDLTALANWTVSKVTNMGDMFSSCSSLTKLTGLSGWKVSNVKDMRNMFQNCSKLTDLTALKDWSWNVSNVNMSRMFYGCSSLTDLTGLSGWNVSNVTDMSYMFYDCSSLTALTGLSGWNVSNVTNMFNMFYRCSKLTDLTGLKDWNVSKVTSMGSMFLNCSKLTDLTALKDWNVSQVTSMGSMFFGCSSLTDLTGLAGWNVSKVKYMGSMFYHCSSLTDLTALASWNVSKVTDMYSMFSGCSSLQKVGIPSIENGGQRLVSKASNAKLPDSLGSQIITEDLQLGPYTWSELNAEMTASPDTFNEGHVWVRYIPSWIVTYDGNGGVGSQTDSKIPLSEPLTLPKSQFLRFGYKFIGWTTQQGSVSSENPLMLPGTTYKPDNLVDGENYHLYAQWERIGGEEDQPVTGQSGSLPGWVQVGSENTSNDILPNKSQSVVFTNKYEPELTSIQFRFTKLMDGNVPDAGNSFQFELIDVTQNKVIQTTVNNGASVQFDPITYDNPDPSEHVYYVRESPSSPQDNVNANPSIDYDDHLVEIKVKVTEEDDSTSPSGKKLTATAQVTGDTVFRNKSKPASLDITKTVTGVTEGMNDNHKDREFTFNVNLLDRDNQPVSGKTYPTMITNNSESSESNGDDSSSTSSITFDSKGNATIGLRAGSKLTINGIPAYYKYTITETNIPAGYENTSLTNSSGILGANSHVTVDAVNHYTATPASVSLQAGKTLLAPGGLNQSVNNGEFRFALCQVTPLPIGSESGPNAESCTGVSEASNDGNGLVTFPQLTYDAPGTYRYKIREVKGDALDMKYDSTVYRVTVKVTDDGEGRLVATITYRNNTTGVASSPGLKPVWDPSDPGAMGVPVFVNRTTVANRLPVTGGRDIIIASVILALVLAGGLFVFLRRNREE